MAKPIEYEVTLTGEDARAFHEYMERPYSDSDSTPESREITKEALEISKRLPIQF